MKETLWVPTLVFVFLSINGCAASGPLPSQMATTPVVQYSTELVSRTTAGTLDRMLKTVDDGEEPSYRWAKGWWCPRHPSVGDAADVAALFAGLCESRQGSYDDKGFCRSRESQDEILFLARATESLQCSGGPTASVIVIEPTQSSSDPIYIDLLREYGFENQVEHDARVNSARKEQQDNLDRELRTQDQNQRDQVAREEAMKLVPVGAKICKDTVFEYTEVGGEVAGVTISADRSTEGILIAQLDGFSPGQEKIQFRILGHEIIGRTKRSPPLAAYPVAGDFTVFPGSVYWDNSGYWEEC